VDVPPSPWRRVALLGIAQRSVQVKYATNAGSQKRDKVLKLNIKTAGDWLKVQRMVKNLTPGHVASKMGIATSLICSWESSTRRPDGQQLKVLAAVLGFDAKDFEAFASGH
jgi:DNA-binding transcriptional regulator YiaG